MVEKIQSKQDQFDFKCKYYEWKLTVQIGKLVPESLRPQ